jgi:hypothetical protein
MSPKNDHQMPILEPDRGQYLKIANWIQQLKHRECIVRRYESEKKPDRYIRHVEKTRNFPKGEPAERLYDVKERLLQERGVRVRDALDVINRRDLGAGKVTSTESFSSQVKTPPQI